MENQTLNSENVLTLFSYVLFKDEEDKKNYVVGEGVRLKCGFHPERIKEKEPEIINLLSQLPDEFFKTKGGGWTFLNACTTKDGELWGQHESVDQLLALGTAIKKVSWLMPRDQWHMFPGGMPYLVVAL